MGDALGEANNAKGRGGKTRGVGGNAGPGMSRSVSPRQPEKVVGLLIQLSHVVTAGGEFRRGRLMPPMRTLARLAGERELRVLPRRTLRFAMPV